MLVNTKLLLAHQMTQMNTRCCCRRRVNRVGEHDSALLSPCEPPYSVDEHALLSPRRNTSVGDRSLTRAAVNEYSIGVDEHVRCCRRWRIAHDQ